MSQPQYEIPRRPYTMEQLEMEVESLRRRMQTPATERRRSPGRVTRVVSDLLVFAEVGLGSNDRIGLVFTPDRIEEYGGEHLADIGVVEGAPLASVVWDPSTRLVERVAIQSSSEDEPLAAR